MSRWSKFRQRLLSGSADQNIDFSDITGFLQHAGFQQRIKSASHISLDKTSKKLSIFSREPIKL
ncbi:MAG TPA: hypothetical protein VK934_11630 [Fimbriimonas sp.]|nr:hypothetical protein [Fimbriimonas sp.]